MMDKNREAFEAWFNDPEKVDIREAYAWRVWQASRQAIEVNLPEKVFEEDEFDNGHNRAIEYCAEALTSLGIRVKGNEE